MRALLIGRGRMGAMLAELLEAGGHSVLARLDQDDIGRLSSLPKADVAIDFSAPGALEPVCGYVRRTGTPLVCGVTGYGEGDMEALRALGAFAPVLYSANYSLGVAVFKRLLEVLGDTPLADWDVEITETHHNRKADAPSGTAKLLLAALDPAHSLRPVYGREGLCGPRQKGEVGMHALRGGTVAGEHTVAFFGEDEAFELTHKAASRRVFAAGALEAAQRLAGREKGFYTLEQIVFGGNPCSR